MYSEQSSYNIEEGWPLSLNCYQPFIGYYHEYATSLNKSIEGVKLKVNLFNFCLNIFIYLLLFII